VSESNGTQHRNRALYAAAIALIELGRATKPQLGPDGRQSAPLIPPLPGDISLRLGYNRNSLQAIAETIEAEQKTLREQCGLQDTQSVKTPEEREAWAKAAKTYDAANQALLTDTREWHSPAPVRVAQLVDRHLPDEWLAAFLAVGIVTGDFPAENPPDAKRKGGE
jgi:hypothetical protein